MCTFYWIHASRPFGHAATCQTIVRHFTPKPCMTSKQHCKQVNITWLVCVTLKKKPSWPRNKHIMQNNYFPNNVDFVKSSHRYFLNSYLEIRMQGELFANYAWKLLPIHYRNGKFKQKLLPFIRHAYIYCMTAIIIDFASLFFWIYHCSMTGIITHPRFKYNMYKVMTL